MKLDPGGNSCREHLTNRLMGYFCVNNNDETFSNTWSALYKRLKMECSKQKRKVL